MPKKKDRDPMGMGMIGGGLMLGVGATGLETLGAPSGLTSAMILPTKFIPLGIMAKMSKRTISEIHKIPRYKWRF